MKLSLCQELLETSNGDTNRFFSALDSNADGLVSTQEWSALFARMEQGLGLAKVHTFLRRLEDAEVQRSRNSKAQPAVVPIKTEHPDGAVLDTQRVTQQLAEKEMELEQSVAANQALHVQLVSA